MTFPEWLFSTFSSATLIVVLAWLCRELIATRLKASVQHEFDQGLEALRADFRKSEELLKADLRAKESQITALQTGALSGMVSRQAALDKRRLEAIDQLWQGIETLAPYKFATILMQTIDFQKAREAVSRDPRGKEVFAQFAPNLDPRNIPKVDVHKARPFVSEMAWALFSAYHAIVGYATMQVLILGGKLNPIADILDPTAVSKLVLTALPYYSEYIQEHGDKGYPYIAEPLEAALLKELQRMMRGEESDKSSIEQAARIMQEVKTVNEAITKGTSI